MKVTLDEDVDILKKVHNDYNKGFMSTKFDVTQVKYREKKKKITNKLDN